MLFIKGEFLYKVRTKLHTMMTHILMSLFKESTERWKTRFLKESVENADLYKATLKKTMTSQLSKHSSWWRRLEGVFRLHLQKTSSRRLDQGEYVRLRHTSSEDVFRTSSRRLGQDQYNRLGHMSSWRLAKMSSKGLQNVFKTS